MKKIIKLLLISFFAWLIPFIIGFAAFSFKADDYSLFETVMTVTITSVAVSASVIWLKNIKEQYIKNGIVLGISLPAVSLLFDFIFFLSPSPMQMTFIDYFKDIGLTYIVFPIISSGMGFILYNVNEKERVGYGRKN